MIERTSIVNISGDHEETLVQLARHLGTSKIRRKIFNTVYGRGTRPKSKKQIMEIAKISSSGTNSQQVQNELDHLTKHHLAVRMDNAGQVKDGSRYLYQKDKTVRANKARIIALADNKKAANSIPTKRRPLLKIAVPFRPPSRSILRKRNRLTVLYLTSNPELSSPLRLDAEIRGVQEAIRGSVFRDNITIEHRPAADLNTLIDGLNDFRPQIVHFSGHGEPGAIITDLGRVTGRNSRALSFDLLAKAIAATDTPPRIIVLNSCNSSTAKKAFLPSDKIIVSMRVSITDIAAAAFATRFYAAIASGQSIKSAFDQGKVAVEAVSLNETETPELLHERTISPSKITLT